MPTSLDYASHIIDITQAMIEYRKGLSKDQFHRISLINHYMVEYVTVYMQHENTSLPALLKYLTNGYQKPLKSALVNTKQLLSGKHGKLEGDYVDALKEIHDCVYEMVEDIRQLCHDLREFMHTMELNEGADKT